VYDRVDPVGRTIIRSEASCIYALRGGLHLTTLTPEARQTGPHIRLLGEFRVSMGTEPVTTLLMPRLQALLAYLLLHPDAPQPRQQIAFLFWPDSSEEQAQSNLRNLLMALRRDFPDAERYIAIERRTLQWRDSSHIVLDVDLFKRALNDAGPGKSDGNATSALLKRAVDLYTGDLLPACYDEWVLTPREELRQSYLSALEALIDALEREGDLASAILYAQRLLRHDPLQEDSYRRLMRLYLALGDRAALVNVYRQCEKILDRELQVEPTEATRALLKQAEEMVRHQGGEALDGDAKGPPRPDNNLPAQTTAFIGREREVVEIGQLLRHEARRLITLTGTAGSGKSRLALQVAAQFLATDAATLDGVYFVPLAPLSDPELVPGAIAQAIGVTETANRPVHESLIRALAEKRILLLLDNFEHILPAVGLVGDMLAACPGIKVLVTSRASLNLRGEYEYPVPAMPMPGAGGQPDPEQIAQYESVSLFVERAGESLPRFTLNRENARAIAEICRRLEGLPLAIELAAARVKVLSPETILSRLDRRLKLLVGGRVDLPPRQRALDAAIEWSYRLLSEDEKRLFRGLSVFRGGCTLEAAEMVLGADDDDPERGVLPRHAVLDTLTSLLSKSLITRAIDKDRYLMLETLREYAHERLAEAGEEEMALSRHARYFIRLGEEADVGVVGPDQARWLRRLDEDHDNLRVVLALALANRNVEGALRLATSIGRFWQYRSYFSEGIEWSGKVIDLASAELDNGHTHLPEEKREELLSLLARALHHKGFMTMRQGNYDEAHRHCARALEISRTLGDRRKVANIIVTLGNLAFHRGRYSEAVELCEEGLGIFREEGDKAGLGYAAHSLGMTAVNQGRFKEAKPLLEESLALQRELGSKSGAALDLLWLGRLALNEAHDTEAARRYFDESLELSQELGNRWMEGWLLMNLGEAARYSGGFAEARAYYSRSRDILDEVGERTGVATALVNIVYLDLDGEGEPPNRTELRVMLAEAFSLLSNGSDMLALAQTIAGFGRYWDRQGSPERAAALYAAAAAMQEHYSMTLDAVDLATIARWITQAREKISPEAWEAAWNKGSRMTWQEAAEFAQPLG
jgi:predicted ATPase/DNA-binding SARP family transcriptional activator